METLKMILFASACLYVAVYVVGEILKYVLSRRTDRAHAVLNAKYKRLALARLKEKWPSKSKVEKHWEKYLLQLEDPGFLYGLSEEELNEQSIIIDTYLQPLQKSPESLRKKHLVEIKRLKNIQSKINFFLKPHAIS